MMEPSVAADLAADAASQWQALNSVLEGSFGTEGGQGVAAQHPLPVREEAARALIRNHARVLEDRNPSPSLNIDGKPLTQTFTRVPPEDWPHVDAFLREVARRLIGVRAGSRSLVQRDAPSDASEAMAWVAATKYMQGRIQSTPEQKPGRHRT